MMKRGPYLVRQAYFTAPCPKARAARKRSRELAEHDVWKAVERERINLIAARVLEQAPFQTKVAQRTPLAVARAACHKLFGNTPRAGDSLLERSLVDEQQATQQLLGRALKRLCVLSDIIGSDIIGTVR